MEQRRVIKEFYRKIVDRFKGGKKKTHFYWPEFDKYCGCCSLSTGIYIRSVITLIISTISLLINGAMLNHLLNMSPIIHSENVTAINKYVLNGHSLPERDLETLELLYKSMVVYYIMWISFKVIYVITVLWTAYAIYRKKPRMLKVLLYVSIPNWVLDFFISLIGTSILADQFKILLVICNLSEGYNILAINSEYKRMRGKLRLAANLETEPRTEPVYANNYINPQGELRNRNQPHCRSCSCFNEGENRSNFQEIPIRHVEASNTESVVHAVNDNVEDTVRNIPSEITYSNERNTNIPLNSAIDTRERPSGLNVGTDNNNLDIIEKIDVIDVPVIYDEQQLNVGTSPVIEDRQFLDHVNDSHV